MSDFNPLTLFYILSESMGFWLGALIVAALILLAGILLGVTRLRKADRSAKRPLIAALVTGAVTTLIFTFLMPVWTLAGPGALVSLVDYFIAGLLALVPGGIVGAIVFFLAASKCAARSPVAFNNA